MELENKKVKVFYTDTDFKTLGELENYKIDIDIYNKCNFQITTYEKLDINTFWYIPDSPYGGYIEKAETNVSKQYVYSGPSLQGFLNYVKIDQYTYANKKINTDGTYHLDISDVCTTITKNISRLKNNSNDTYEIFWVLYDFDTYVDENNTIREYDVNSGTGGWDAIREYAEKYGLSIDTTVYPHSRLEMAGRSLGYLRTISDWYVEIRTKKPEIHEDKQYLFPENGALSITNYGKGINHLICQGTNQDKETTVIHMFWDEDGNLQPYAKNYSPKSDDDYILDERKKVITGHNEKTDVIKISSSCVEVYEPLACVPFDWFTNYQNYYELVQKEDGSYEYKNIEPVKPTQNYRLLTSKPADWDTNWQSYYKRTLNEQGTYEYQPVENISNYIYNTLWNEPVDWKYSYSQYYWYGSLDGESPTYHQYSQKQEEYYDMVVDQPYHWYSASGPNVVYNKYYMYRQDEDDTKPELHQVDKLYHWTPGRFYAKKTRDITPKFNNPSYIRKRVSDSAPQWTTNQFYSLEESNKIPRFLGKTYYRKIYNNYAKLIEEGIAYYSKQKRGYVPEATILDDGVRINDVVVLTNSFTDEELYCKAKNIIAKVDNGTITTEVTVGV